jgi:hypothetical protein
LSHINTIKGFKTSLSSIKTITWLMSNHGGTPNMPGRNEGAIVVFLSRAWQPGCLE